MRDLTLLWKKSKPGIEKKEGIKNLWDRKKSGNDDSPDEETRVEF